MPANRVDRALRFVLEGDSKSAQTAFLEFEAAAAKAEQATANMAVKIQNDLKAMEEQAKVASASIAKIGESGAGGGAAGGGLMDMFGMGGGGGLALGVEAAGLAVAHFGESSVRSFTEGADAVRKFQQVTGASAEEASKLVNLSGLLGVSQETLAQGMGRFGANIEKNVLTLRQHGIEIAANKDGSIDLSKTFVNVATALGQTTDAAERDALARQLLGRGYQQLLPLLTQSASELKHLADLAGQGPMFNQDDVTKALHFEEQMRSINQHITEIKARVGSALIDNLEQTAAGAKAVDEQLGHISSHLKDIADATPSWLGHALGAIGLHSALQTLLGPLAPMVQALQAAGTEVHKLGDGKAEIDSLPPSFDQVGKAAQIAEGKVWSLQSAISSARNAWSSFATNANFAETAADSFDKALQAFDTAASKAGGAASNLAYAQEMGAQRIADAQQRIVDAEESSSRRVVDAQTRVKEAREAAADALKSAAQSVEDAKQHLVDEQLAGLRDANPYAAQRRVDVARRNLGRAEERLSSTQDRESENVARAELELQRAQEDRTKAITKANEALVKTQEEVAHSLQHTGGAAGGASQTLADMKSKVDTLVKATGEHVDAMVLQGKGLDEIAKAVEIAKSKVDQVGAAWGWPQAQVDAYKAKLDAIPKEVTTSIGLTLNSYAFKVQVDELMKQFSNQGPLNDLVRVGVEAAIGGSGFIADEGGVLPPGISIIQNKTGHDEYIINPALNKPVPAGMGGVNVQVDIHGSAFASAHELADEIYRAVKQGLVGFR